MQNNEILAALAMDLKRVALGLHRHSFKTADRFSQEALRWKNQTNVLLLKPYMQNIFGKLDDMLQNSDTTRKAEDALMYSTLIQNYVVKEQKEQV